MNGAIDPLVAMLICLLGAIALVWATRKHGQEDD